MAMSWLMKPELARGRVSCQIWAPGSSRVVNVNLDLALACIDHNSADFSEVCAIPVEFRFI